MSFDKIPGQSGYLVLSLDGAILSSGGELENDEKTATNIFKFVSAATKGDFGSEIDKISVNYAEHSYVVATSGRKIHIVKRNVA